MLSKGHYRRKYWTQSFLWIGLIYSTLYVARPACEFLRSVIPLSSVINGFFISAVMILSAFVWYKAGGFKPLSVVIMLIIISGYAYGLFSIKYPEEKLHLLEYGMLSFLIFRAVRVDVPKPSAYFLAWVLTVLFGWIDEVIQYYLPNRYYHIEDVALNAASGFLGLLWVYVMRREHIGRRF